MNKEILKALDATWKGGVAEDYRNGLVVSESSLMSVWHHHLRMHFNGSDCRIFTEPSLYLKQDERYRRYEPDIMLGGETPDGRRALAVIEIKWVPFHRPDYLQDLGKLASLAQPTGESYCAAVCPQNGKEYSYESESKRHFVVDVKTLFVFAAVGWDDSEALDWATISERFRSDGGDLRRFAHFRGATTKIGNEFPTFETQSEH